MQLSTALQPTLIATLWPSATARSSGGLMRMAVLAVAGTALLTLSAKIQVPFWPVPMTMQTFAVLVIGAAYGWRLGALTVLLYLAEGALGLPVFSRGGGLAYFAGPTSGYLFGFVAAAMLVGWLAERGWDRSVPATLFTMALGTALIFIPGVAWLSVFLMQAKGITLTAGVSAALANGLTPFLAGAAAKIALAAAVMPYAWILVGRYKT